MDATSPQKWDCLITPGWSTLSDGNCTSSDPDCVLSWDPDSCFAGWDMTDWVNPELDSSVLADKPLVTSESDCPTDSTSHSLSPISSIDSYRFSPHYLPGASPPEARVNASLPSSPGGQRSRKARSRCPSRQRRNASEREKLRMRGLAEALQNLRTYLPPSVVPAAQTLTKLETLRLAIRYIAHLTELLSEELPSKGRDTEDVYQEGCQQGLGCCQSWLRHPVHLPSFSSPLLPTSHQPESQYQHVFLQDFNCEKGSIQASQYPPNYMLDSEIRGIPFIST